MVEEFVVEELRPRPAAAIRAEVPADQIRDVFDQGFSELAREIGASSTQIAGPPFGFYPRMPTETIEVIVGFPVESEATFGGRVTPFTVPGGKVLKGTHHGSYEGLAATYGRMAEFAKERGLKLGPGMWETYVSDPTTTPMSEWRTDLFWPLE